MPVQLIQSLVDALLLLVVAFVGGTLGLRRFEAIERSIAELRTEFKTDISSFSTRMTADHGALRTELTTDTAGLRTELTTDIGELGSELKADIAALRTELRTDIGELRVDMKADLAKLREEQAQMRSDLTYIALAVGARRAEG